MLLIRSNWNLTSINSMGVSALSLTDGLFLNLSLFHYCSFPPRPGLSALRYPFYFSFVHQQTIERVLELQLSIMFLFSGAVSRFFPKPAVSPFYSRLLPTSCADLQKGFSITYLWGLITVQWACNFVKILQAEVQFMNLTQCLAWKCALDFYIHNPLHFTCSCIAYHRCSHRLHLSLSSLILCNFAKLYRDGEPY